MDIQNISDTALWVAQYRAMETARADALFQGGSQSSERNRKFIGKSRAWAFLEFRSPAIEAKRLKREMPAMWFIDG